MAPQVGPAIMHSAMTQASMSCPGFGLYTVETQISSCWVQGIRGRHGLPCWGSLGYDLAPQVTLDWLASGFSLDLRTGTLSPAWHCMAWLAWHGMLPCARRDHGMLRAFPQQQACLACASLQQTA